MQKPLLEFKKFRHQIHLLVEKEAKRRGFQFLAGPQGEVLTFLAKREHEGQVTLIRDIEQELGISKSMRRNLVKRMEKNNLIYLEESPTDKRAKYVFLKEGIKNQLEDMHQFFEEVDASLLDGVSQEDLAIFFKVKHQFYENMKKESRMIKLFRRLTAKEWGMMVLATIFIGIAVWMDLKIPEYLSDITRLLAKQGTKVADILEARRKNVALVTR